MGKTARLLLRDNWLKAVLMTAVTLLLLSITFLTQIMFFSSEWALVFSLVVTIFVINPITLGYKRWCTSLKPDEKADFCDLFYFFKTPKRYIKGVFVGLAVSLRVLSKAVLSMFLPSAFFAISLWLNAQPLTEITEIFIKNCLFLGLVSTVIFAILFFITASRNIAISYFIAADEKTKIRDAVKLSSRFMEAKSGCVFKTICPFLPLCIFVIPIFFLIPYFVTVFSQYIKSFKQEITFACV